MCSDIGKAYVHEYPQRIEGSAVGVCYCRSYCILLIIGEINRVLHFVARHYARSTTSYNNDIANSV